MCCLLVLGSAISISCLVIGLLNPHNENPCMKKDKIGLYLDDWLVGKGIASLCVLGVHGIALICFFVVDTDHVVVAVLGVVYYLFVVASVLFNIIWFVMGVVILARSSGECVSDWTDPAVMAIITFVLSGIFY
jgi:hypothetical protein